jgi:3-hydroxy-9,10-secoandrosta-1,3,5(10)-triene-9,17-dione monooxygenase reductase component
VHSLPLPSSVAPDAPAVDPQALRHALGQFATGVTVVTTLAAGRPVGMTVNSFASVSLDPPLILWSVGRSAECYQAFANAAQFRVHVLAADQEPVSRRFATRGAEKFSVGDWTFPTDAPPQLAGCVAWFECRSASRHPEGDHLVLVGRVIAQGATGGAPLLFHDSRYGRLGSLTAG